jgi:ribosome-binding factor A
MPREFSRNQRLGNQIQRALSEFLRSEVKDPRLENVSLTAVELSRDLGVAQVYFSLLDPAQDVAPAAAGLQSAAGFLRSRLGRAIKVRHIPELRFVHDDSAKHAAHISQLIDKAIHTKGSRPDGERD